MNCNWREEQAYSFADGSMDPTTERDFEAHLLDCSRCRSLVGEAREVDALLRSALAPVPVPATLGSRLAWAVAMERETRRRRWWVPPLGRLSLSPVSILAVVLALLATSYLVAPGAVIAVVQRALLFVPGIGIRSVEQGHLVAPNPVAAKSGPLTFQVEALLSNGEATTVQFSLTGLPGGKDERVAQAGKDQNPPAPRKAPAQPVLRDPAGREYPLSSGYFGVGGSEERNTIQGQLHFAPLPSNLDDVDLVMPSEWLDLTSLAPETAPESWTVRIPLAPASSSGLPAASPRGDSATARGVTLRVAALSTEAGRTVVLLEGQAEGGARVNGVGKNGGDVTEEITLRDNLGRDYPLSPRSRTTMGDQPYREDLYFPALAPLARQLTLTVQSLRIIMDGSASVSIPVDRIRPGESLPLDQAVEISGQRVLLKSARVDGNWLHVDVNLGPTVDGQTLSNFSLDGRGSHMVSMGQMGGQQMSHFGVELRPGETEVRLEMSRPLVNLDGPWEMTIPVQPRGK